MAMQHVTETSYYALQAMSVTVCALAELADIIPEEDRYASLIRILSERLDADMQALSSEVYNLMGHVPRLDEDQAA